VITDYGDEKRKVSRAEGIFKVTPEIENKKKKLTCVGNLVLYILGSKGFVKT